MERKRRGRLGHQEEVLAAHVEELKADLSACRDAQMAAKLASSVGGIKSVEEYARDRQASLQRLLQVDHSCELIVHCDMMRQECELCTKPFYTPSNLPLILHQFYSNRVSQLVQLKHILMVRWARFAGTDSKLAEEFYHHFEQKMKYLMFVYNDSLHRARRFAPSNTTIKTTPTVTINSDDVMIYLRWLVTHYHNTKTPSSFIANIVWLPSLYRSEFMTILQSPTSYPPTHTPQSHRKKSAPSATSQWLLAARKDPHIISTTRTDSTHVTSHVTGSDITRDHVTLPSSLGGASGAVGVASNQRGVVSTSLPLHTTDMTALKESLQQLMTTYSIRGCAITHSPADELQLYYESSHKFQTLLPHQEPRLSPYDSGQSEQERGGRNGDSRMFKKPSNWLKFIQIISESDPNQIISYSKIRDNTMNIDPLLSLSSLTSHLHTPARAMQALRQHAVTVKQPTLLPSLSATSTHHTSHTLVWKSLYMGLDNRNPMKSDGLNSMETDAMETRDALNNGDPMISVKEATQVLKNDKGRVVSTMALSVAKDTYLSYLLLRHLHTRDNRTTCLSILNYFQSVERTLTINHQGLSMESGHQQPTSSGGLLTHRHLHNNPADYKISEVKFMQFTEVENHDDFYEFHSTPESGRGLVTVWDSQGVNIIYDAALEDLRGLEKELLIIGTYYIEKGCGLVSKGGGKDMAGYSRRDVDRMAVLHDLWRSEAGYQDNKMKLVNCYLECYHHTSDRTEREKMAKVITTLIKARPHYDPDSAYFTVTFDLECQCLEAHRRLVESIVTMTMEAERNHSNNLWEGKSYKTNEAMLGLPPSPLHHVSLTGHKQLLPPSSLLEVLSSLSIISTLPHSLHVAITQLTHHHTITISPTLTLSLQLKLLEIALLEWEEHSNLGDGYTDDVIQNVFNDRCVEDANVICGMCEEWMDWRMREREGDESGGEDKHTLKLQTWCDLLQLIFLRHYLLTTTTETTLLIRHCKQLLHSLKYDECHAHLRCMNFDPSMKAPTDKSLEYFISKVKDNNLSTILDQYVPAKYSLAVAELDDKQMTNFSFKTHHQIIELLRDKASLVKLQTTLKCQVIHKWSLAISSLINTAIIEGDSNIRSGGPVVGVATPPRMVGMGTTASDMGRDIFLKKTLQKMFVSIQIEKVPVRDHMLAVLSSKLHSTGKSRNDMETAKCAAIGQFCGNLATVMSQYSLRYQILQLYSSLRRILDNYPATRDSYFTIGQISTNQKPVPPLVKDPRSPLSHPPLILSDDGSMIRNLWYIPHSTEILTMFSDRPLDDRITCLRTILSLIAPQVLLLQYYTAYVRLGRVIPAGIERSGRRDVGGDWGGVGGDWGGVERVGTVVQQLQNDIASLPDPSDPHQVSSYLHISCHVFYLQHIITLKHYLQRTFLLHDNQAAIQTLRTVSIPTISRLSTSSRLESPHPLYHSLMPMTCDQSDDSSTLLPWQHFLSQYSSTSSLPDHHIGWEVGDIVMAGLAALLPDDRVTANGEMLGLSLIFEEAIQCHTSGSNTSNLSSNDGLVVSSSNHQSHSTHTKPITTFSVTRQTSKTSLNDSSASSSQQQQHRTHMTSSHDDHMTSHGGHMTSCDNTTSPIKRGERMKEFFILSLQLETLRAEWALQILGGDIISSQLQARQVEQAFKERVVGVARKEVAKQLSHDHAKMVIEGDGLDESMTMSQSTTFLTEGGVSVGGANGDTLSAEQMEGISEFTLRKAQVTRLLELLELGLIRDTLRHVSRFHHLMMLEQNRDHTTLPLDLWKTSPSMKEPAGVPRPHITDRFLSQFHSNSTDTGTSYTITKKCFLECVYQMSCDVIHREKECFQIYSGHYEGLVRSLYAQLYQRDREVKSWREKAEMYAQERHTEALITTGELTHSTLLELTALRVRIKELETQLDTQEAQIRQKIRQEYSSLTQNLLSTCIAMTTRYEDYRASLFSDVLRCVQEVRSETAEGVARAKENHGNGGGLAVSVTTSLQGKEECDIQMENARLNNLLLKQRAMIRLRQHIHDDRHKQEVSVCREESEGVRRRGLEERMVSETEIQSLKTHVNILQKRVVMMERETDTTGRKQMIEKDTSIKSTATSTSQVKTMPKSSKVISTKMKQLAVALEEKDRKISHLESTHEKQHREEEEGHKRLTHKLQMTRQQLENERQLKREAFHQVDDLLTQVHDLEDQQHVSLKALQSKRDSITTSTSRPRSHTSSTTSTPHTARYHQQHHTLTSASSLPHSRPQSRNNKHKTRPPKSQQQDGVTHTTRPTSSVSAASETINLSQDILALKLI